MALTEEGLKKIAEAQRLLHGNTTGISKKYIKR